MVVVFLRGCLVDTAKTAPVAIVHFQNPSRCAKSCEVYLFEGGWVVLMQYWVALGCKKWAWLCQCLILTVKISYSDFHEVSEWLKSSLRE